MDPDARDPSPEPQPYEDLDDDLGDDWARERSPTPAHGDDGGAGSSKPRKRLLKKGGGGMPGDDGLEDFGLEDADPAAEAKKRTGSSGYPSQGVERGRTLRRPPLRDWKAHEPG